MNNKFRREQNGFWTEVLCVTKRGNFFLYTEVSEISKKQLYFKKDGKNITPIDPGSAFEYLEKRGADASCFEKHFADKLEMA